MSRPAKHINPELTSASEITAKAIYHQPEKRNVVQVRNKVQKLFQFLQQSADTSVEVNKVIELDKAPRIYGNTSIFWYVMTDTGVFAKHENGFLPLISVEDITYELASRLCIEMYWVKTRVDQGTFHVPGTPTGKTRISFKLARTSYDIAGKTNTQRRFCPQCQQFIGPSAFRKMSTICFTCEKMGPVDKKRAESEKRKAQLPEEDYRMPYTHKIRPLKNTSKK